MGPRPSWQGDPTSESSPSRPAKVHLSDTDLVSKMLPPNRDPRTGDMPNLRDPIDDARRSDGVVLYLASVGLVAAASIVLFSVASFSLLGTSKLMLTGSSIHKNSIQDVSIGTAVFYGSNTAPVPVPTKVPSSSRAHNLRSATLVPAPSSMSAERTTVEPALKPLSDGETSATAVETPHGSTRGPPTEEASPAEPSGSQQVISQPLSIADEASAAQHASGATVRRVTISDGEPDQKSQNFEIQREHQANLDEASAAFTLDNRFPENQVKDSLGFDGSAASAGSDPPLLHAAPRGRRAIKSNRDEIADRLNHAELGRLVGGGRASPRAPRR